MTKQINLMYTTKKDKGNPLPADCRKTSIVDKNGVAGATAPVQVVSHLCHRIVQWLCAADCKHPCLVWGGSPSNIALSRGKGFGIRHGCEIERPKALQDAKPTKRSYRDRGQALLLKKHTFSTN